MKLFHRLRALFRKDGLDQDLSDEMAFHLEKQIEQNIAAGMSAEEARYAALRKFGSVEQVKEDCRDAWGVRFIDTILQDLRFGLRQLRKNPAFTAVAVLTLALGIGGTVVVFSLLDAVLRPISYPQPDRLFRVFPDAMEASSYPDFRDWQRQSRTFQSMAAYQELFFNLTGSAEPERLDGSAITPGFFATLGIRPVLGREFKGDDDEHVAMLSYQLWQRRFGGDSGIVGKFIDLEGRTYTVVGVLPPQLRFRPQWWGGSASEVFVPVIPNLERDWFYVRVLGRLAPGVSEQQALAEMNGIVARLAQAHHEPGKQGIALEPLAQYIVSNAGQTAWVLFGAVTFVLLIACANVANLLLSQGAAREREMAIRTAVGATRARILRQLLTESLLLAGSGGAIGVALAYWTIPLAAGMAPSHGNFSARIQDAGVHLNLTVLIFSALLAVLSSALFGILPALKAIRPAQSSRSSGRVGRARGCLIALEVALSFVLLVGAGLMMKSLLRLLKEDVGFRTEHLLTMDISLSEGKYSAVEKQTAYFDRVLQGLTTVPAVLSVGAVTDLPLTRNETWNKFEIPGPHPGQGQAGYNAVSPDYFRAMGISLLNGRELRIADSANSPVVGVINRSMANKYWPNENPIGKTIEVYRPDVERTPKGEHVHFKPHMLEIVGIVGDIRQLGLDAPPDPELFVSYAQWPSNEMALVLRTASEPSSLVPAVKNEIWQVDPDQPVADIKTMDELVSTEAAGKRFVLQLIGVFASIALLLAAVGIYGVVSYATRQQTHEIGIRMALGAKGKQIWWWVAGQNAKWLLIGITTGAAGALALTRLLAAYLYEVRSTDPLTFAAVALLLLAVALTATHFPARRATKVDPMVALRHE